MGERINTDVRTWGEGNCSSPDEKDSLLVKTVEKSRNLQTVGEQYEYLHVYEWSRFSEQRKKS